MKKHSFDIEKHVSYYIERYGEKAPDRLDLMVKQLEDRDLPADHLKQIRKAVSQHTQR